MEPLKCCPFCSSSDLYVLAAKEGREQAIRVVCRECGATGPRGMATDTPAQAAHAWNLRFGVGTEH